MMDDRARTSHPAETRITGRRMLSSRTWSLAAVLTVLGVSAAMADLSFIQVIQAQSSRGQDGVFGKSWVEVRGKSMRIVSGYARKLQDGKGRQNPRRVIQIMDLGARSRLLVRPEDKTYSRAPLSEVDYGDASSAKVRRPKGGAHWEISHYGISVAKESSTRRLMGAECTHYRITAELELSDQAGRMEKARMDQHAWVVPVSGKLSETLLDLMAFENSYREATGGELSPLDHERYQVREVASYLDVPEDSLRRVVMEARSRMRELPSYPVASLMAWRVGPPSKPQRGASPGPNEKTRVRTAPTRGPRRVRFTRPRMVVMNWHFAEQAMNLMHRQAQSELAGPPEGGPDEDPGGEQDIYPKFKEELRKVLADLVSEQDRLADKLPQPRELPEASESGGPAPFYEVYAELHGLEAPGLVPAQDFALPKGYREVPYVKAR